MTEQQLSSVEAELYDRQIRLWGIESQEKLRAANILLIGVGGVGSEVLKNIVLTGVNSIVIVDDTLVTSEELAVNFLLTSDAIGKKIGESVLLRAQALNPLVKLSLDSNIDEKNLKYFAEFSIVICTRMYQDDILKISAYCRENNVKFIYGDAFGMFGYTISDFQEHNYYEDRVKLPLKRERDGKKTSSETITERIHAKFNYPPISEVLTFPENTKPKRVKNIFYYLMLALLQYNNKRKSKLDFKDKTEIVTSLQETFTSIAEKYGIDPSKLDFEVFELLFGEVVPVCSIIAGVIAQEVVKAVSGKEVPINNVFILNPLNYSGKEETISY